LCHSIAWEEDPQKLKSSAVPNPICFQEPSGAKFIQLHSTDTASRLTQFIHVEGMVDETPTAHSPDMESDSSHNEKKPGATVDPHDIPDPDAHLSEAERKAIVCFARIHNSPSNKFLG
jgi:hypothetical protein